jgi:hypothetical protein
MASTTEEEHMVVSRSFAAMRDTSLFRLLSRVGAVAAILSLILAPAQAALAAPSAASFSSVTWCFRTDVGTAGSIGENDAIQINGLLNHTGATSAYRIGVRLVSGYGGGTLIDHTFGGPTHLFGASNSKDETTNAPIADLNLFGVASTNSDYREGFGEVQNTFPIGSGSSGDVHAVLGIGKISTGTSLRVELYAYDNSGTQQATLVGSSIPYDATKPGCTAATASAQDVGTGFIVTGAGSGGTTTKYAGGWINVNKPVLTSGDANLLLEFSMLATETPKYEHDFDQGAPTFVIEVFDRTANAVVATISGDSSTKEGCNYTLTVSTGSASLVCRLQQYYSNISATVGRTPDIGGYRYDWTAYAAGSGYPMTHVLALPTASNSWLVTGHNYEVRLKANSGTGSHKISTDTTDYFQYSSTPTAVSVSAFHAKVQRDATMRTVVGVLLTLGVTGLVIHARRRETSRS